MQTTVQYCSWVIFSRKELLTQNVASLFLEVKRFLKKRGMTTSELSLKILIMIRMINGPGIQFTGNPPDGVIILNTIAPIKAIEEEERQRIMCNTFHI